MVDISHLLKISAFGVIVSDAGLQLIGGSIIASYQKLRGDGNEKKNKSIN